MKSMRRRILGAVVIGAVKAGPLEANTTSATDQAFNVLTGLGTLLKWLVFDRLTNLEGCAVFAAVLVCGHSKIKAFSYSTEYGSTARRQDRLVLAE